MYGDESQWTPTNNQRRESENFSVLSLVTAMIKCLISINVTG